MTRWSWQSRHPKPRQTNPLIQVPSFFGLTRVTVSSDDHTQSSSSTLFLIVHSGFVLTVIGVAAERKRLHLRFQANTIRNRRVLSLFQLGKLIIAAVDPTKLSHLDLKTALESIKAYEMI